jgi:hypothetical protein
MVHKATTTFDVEIIDHGLKQAHTCGGVRSFNWDPIPPLDNWLSKTLHILTSDKDSLYMLASTQDHYILLDQ